MCGGGGQALTSKERFENVLKEKHLFFYFIFFLDPKNVFKGHSLQGGDQNY